LISVIHSGYEFEKSLGDSLNDAAGKVRRCNTNRAHVPPYCFVTSAATWCGRRKQFRFSGGFHANKCNSIFHNPSPTVTMQTQ